jgi:membrane protease YdiL (CAAX protease family)
MNFFRCYSRAENKWRSQPLLETQIVPTNSEEPDEQKPTPWGFWPTIGFSCVIGVVFLFVSIILSVGIIVAVKILQPQIDLMTFAQSLDSNGLFLAVVSFIIAPLVIGLSVFFAAIRKNITIKEYLCLNRTDWKNFAVWSSILLLFTAFSDALTSALGRPIVSDFTIKAYKTAYFPPLLWLAFIILAPLYEEILFRGFMFKGIEKSRLGPIGALIITSLAWSALHIQYDFLIIASIFAGGLLLGWARLKTNSIYIPIAMHALQNLLATIAVIIYLGRV